MNQWEIYDYPFAEQGSHPVLIISNPARAGNPDIVELNGLFCQSVRPHVPLKPYHFLLDRADGLENPTLVRCDHIRALRREFIGQPRGVVSYARRLPLFRKVLECYRCPP